MRKLTMLLAGILLIGCATAGTYEAVKRAERTITVVIDNQNYDVTSARLYCQRGTILGLPFRGLVSGVEVRRKVSLQNCDVIVAEADGGYAFWVSEPTMVNPGDVVTVRIQGSINLSYVTVRTP